MMRTGRNARDDERWLEGGNKVPASDLLTKTLDDLYANEPSAQASAQAKQRVRRALDAARSGEVYYDVLYGSPFGPIFLGVSSRGVIAVDFRADEKSFLTRLRKHVGVDPVRAPEQVAKAARQLGEYLAGERLAFDLPLDLSALTAFQQRVLLAVSKVPRGEVTTYAELARKIGRPKAARAVGQALGRNPIPIIIPCHRVLASDGSLGGYSGRGGVKTKADLLRLEGALS